MDYQIYAFSGLGADERFFDNISFPKDCVKHIQWIQPIENESISSYALRMSKTIDSKNTILLGLSFGGMMAVEVAKIIETKKVILISSAKTQNEIPFYYRLVGRLKIHKFIPVQFFKSANFFTYWLFGTESKDEKSLMKKILNQTDPVFIKWAIDQILKWENQVVPLNLVHVHGTRDKILPIHFVNSSIEIHNGGHFMILNKSDEMNRILESHILEFEKSI